MNDIQWLIGGEAGYGIMTTGVMISKIFARLGLSVFDYVEYPSLIRGGHNAYYVRGSKDTIYSQKKPVDILVALNRETIDKHKNELAENAAIIFDPTITRVDEKEFPQKVKLIPVPFSEIMEELKVERLMINTMSVGSSLALFHSDFSVLSEILTDTFKKKGEKVIDKNVRTTKAGYDYVTKNFPSVVESKIEKSNRTSLLLSGAEAVGIASIRAGVKFAAIYPMTPINAVLVTLASHALEYGIIVKEPEDEIAGINMAIGASYAGVRSLAATSGGGFSLMVEGFGLAAQTEVPLVVIEGMRPGPATGMPTWTEQGDIRFVLHAHQGDFPRVVLVPSDALECFSMTLLAFNIAEKYQLPVIVLVDKYNMESHMTVDNSELRIQSSEYKIERGKMVADADAKKETDYKRYKLVEDGVSPRTIPGQEGGIALTGSDEHDERGLYNEEAHVRIAMMNKRFQKLETAMSEIPTIVSFGDKNADLTIFAFGSTKMPLLEAIEWLKKEGISVHFVQVLALSPFPTQKVQEVLSTARKTMVIEGNKTGQFEGLIKQYTGKSIDHHFRKYNGRPFYPEEIVEEIKKII